MSDSSENKWEKRSLFWSPRGSLVSPWDKSLGRIDWTCQNQWRVKCRVGGIAIANDRIFLRQEF